LTYTHLFRGGECEKVLPALLNIST